jgi:hypothetical protein
VLRFGVSGVQKLGWPIRERNVPESLIFCRNSGSGLAGGTAYLLLVSAIIEWKGPDAGAGTRYQTHSRIRSPRIK